MRTALIILVYILVAWLEVRPLLRKGLTRDVVAVLIAYGLSLVPAALLLSGNDDLPAINTIIREFVEGILR